MDRQTANDLADVMTHLAGRVKQATARVKEAPTDGSGRVTALVSTFGPPPDTQGDVVAPGAFLQTIVDWRARGKRPAVWLNHDYKNPSAAIGVIEKMYETDAGLVIEAQLDLDHEPALATYEALLSGRMNEWSIGYSVVKEHSETLPKFGRVNVLDEVEILEVSAVSPAGANRFTRTLSVKSANDPAAWSRKIDEAADPKVTITAETKRATDAFLVDEAMAAVQRMLDRDDAARWNDDMTSRARYLSQLTPELEEEREAEYRAREQAEREERDRRKEAEREERERADEARREHARRHPWM